MFAHKHSAVDQEITAARGALEALAATEETWFDGTLGSVEARAKQVRQASSVVAKVTSRGGFTLLAEAEQLRIEADGLSELSERLLNPVTSHKIDIPQHLLSAKLSDWGQRFIAMHTRDFVAENEDAHDDPEEMDVRATNHAELETLQLPIAEAAVVVAHFRHAVSRRVRPAKKTTTAAVEPDVSAFPDSALFG